MRIVQSDTLNLFVARVGIQVARQDLFLNEAAGARPTAAKIAILLTDGPVTRDVDILPTGKQCGMGFRFATS